MPAKKKIETTKPSRSDAPPCSVSSDTPETDELATNLMDSPVTIETACEYLMDHARKLERARNHNRICVQRMEIERNALAERVAVLQERNVDLENERNEALCKLASAERREADQILLRRLNLSQLELAEIKAAMCRDIIEHLEAWFEGATLDPIRLKGMVGTVQSESSQNAIGEARAESATLSPERKLTTWKLRHKPPRPLLSTDLFVRARFRRDPVTSWMTTISHGWNPPHFTGGRK